MPDLTYDPPLPTGPLDGFVQAVRMTESGKTIGHAKWHIVGDGSTGIAQLLEVTIAPPFRRAGRGQAMLTATLDQIRTFFRTRKIAARRVWMNVNQKDQVNGRALLTELGFHHVATIASLLKDQDALVYVLSLD